MICDILYHSIYSVKGIGAYKTCHQDHFILSELRMHTISAVQMSVVCAIGLVVVVVLTILPASCLTAAQEQSGNESSPFPLRPALAAQQLPGVSGDSETCSLPEAQSAIEEVLQQFLQDEVLEDFSCDNAMLGVFEYCPAANCSQIFSASQNFRFPGYYWTIDENGDVIQEHCDFEQFPYTTAEIDTIEDDSCPTTEQRQFVQESIQDSIQAQLSQLSSSVLTCTTQITGIVAHCPVDSCEEVFSLIHQGFLRLSDYYWLRSPDGDVTEVYCNRSTMQPEYSSCQQLFMFETVPSGSYSFRTSDGSYSEVYCNNETGQSEYESCAHVNLSNLPSGTYTIQNSEGNPVTVFCDMDNEECGGGVWTRVASYNYSDPSTTCPGDWTLITSSIRACARISSDRSCSSASFSTSGIQFSSVCGRVIGIQYGSPEAFDSYHRVSFSGQIEDPYVDGVSITHGSPRKHIWTFAAYPSDDYTDLTIICPCSQPSLNVPSPPSYVGNNYFCDTALASFGTTQFYTDDPLWDGQGCGGPGTCCSFNNPPWFSTALPEATSDDIEVRICEGSSYIFDATPIVSLDLYIQ